MLATTVALFGHSQGALLSFDAERGTGRRREAEPILKNSAIARPHADPSFTLQIPGRKLRAFSSITETHSGYLFE